MNGMTMHNLSNGWVDYQNRTCPNTVDFNSAIGGVKNHTEITGHNCGFGILIILTPDLAFHSAGGIKAEYRCSYLSIESQICNSPSNQSAKTTADQSGQYFAALKYETLSYPNLDIPNCGEITPFAKGDFSHLFNVGNSRYLSRIEYLLVDTTRCIIEFSQPIKKGSTANATSLNCIFLKYQLNQSIHHIVNLCWRKDQPFGSIPLLRNSARANSLNQLLNVILSEAAAWLSCSLKSGCIRIWNAGDCPPVFGVRSLALDIVHTFSFNEPHKVCTLYHEYLLKQTPPNDIASTERGLTTMLIGVTLWLCISLPKLTPNLNGVSSHASSPDISPLKPAANRKPVLCCLMRRAFSLLGSVRG